MATKLDVKGFSAKELQEELHSAETQYQKLKFDHVTVGIENPLKIREVRRDIARIKTEMRERTLAEFTPEQLANRSKIRARRKKEKRVAKSVRRKNRK